MQGPPGQPPFGGGGGGYGPPQGGGGGYGGPPQGGGGGYGGPPQGGGGGYGPPQGGGGGYGGPPQGGGGGYGGPPQGFGAPPPGGFGAPPGFGAPQLGAAGARAPAVKLSGGLYIGLYVVSMLSMYGLAGLAGQPNTTEAGLALPLPILVLAGVMLTFLYKIWSSINDGQTKPTPGTAVGFLFIPLFSIYWIFVVWPGFASSYNAYLQRHRINAPPLSMALPLCSLLLGSVPVVGLVLWCMTFAQMARAVNALSTSPTS